MPERANITSLDAIGSFRADLVVYLTRARPVLEEISGEILRMRQWLQEDQRRHWEEQLRRRARKLEEARAELFNATLSKLQEATALQQMAVQRAERAVREAEAKLSIIKKWSRDLENRTELFVKQVDHFHTFLATDMARAIAHLDRAIKTLEDYAAVAPGKKQEAPA